MHPQIYIRKPLDIEGVSIDIEVNGIPFCVSDTIEAHTTNIPLEEEDIKGLHGSAADLLRYWLDTHHPKED